MTVALVTGAGSGIGAAVAAHLAADGAIVIAADRDLDAVEQMATQLTSVDGEVHAAHADVSISADVDRLFATVRTHGRLTVLVNNAGVTASSSLHDMTEDAWDEAFQACVKPTFLCTRAALNNMLTASGGAIVNIASVHQKVAMPKLAAYTAAKGAIVALSKQIAVEYGAQGIRCNVVSPGWIRTASTESRLRGEDDENALRRGHASTRLGTPDDVAAAVAYLASPQAIFVNGAELVIDGASSLVTGIQALRDQVRHHKKGT